VLRREAKIPIEEFKPLKSKTTRLQAVSPLFEQGRIKFVVAPYTDPFIRELTQFPYVAHDDRTDSVVWALHYYIEHMDAGNRMLAESIITHRKFLGSTRRAEVDDSGIFTTLGKTPTRTLKPEGWGLETADIVETTSERIIRGRRSRGRGVGWDG
jgi:hypothetical protein